MLRIVKKTRRYFYELLVNFLDGYKIFKKRTCEKKKYRDKRRINICKSAPLTNEQKKAIDDFYKKHYGHKIPYVWHQNFMAHSGKFDVKYFPELLYIPEFEHFMNYRIEYAKVFADKNVLPILAQAENIKTPKKILSITSGIIKDTDGNVLTKYEACDYLKNIGRVFIKPTVDSCSGNGCFIADFSNGNDSISNKSVMDILCSIGNEAVIQNCINCHQSIKNIYDKSVNTFRVITYRWKNEILHTPTIMRIGQGGSYLDNAHAGGMFIAINDDGTLHKTAITEFNQKFTVHPNTGLTFEDYKINLFPSVISAAKKMHSIIPQLGVINWDFTIDENGTPVLIEANLTNGSVWLIEMAHGCGAFGEKTEEVLQWIKTMKKTAKSERNKYEFGNNI